MKTYKINGKKIEIDSITINPILLQLLEALADKEEPQQEEECEHLFLNDNFAIEKNCIKCLQTIQMFPKKTEELKSIHNPCPYGNDDCPSCKPKQSTSLKEDLHDYFLSEEAIEEILKLIQSHLVKEIESKKIKNDIEPKGGNWSTQDVINLQNTLIEDIIKIINNITSQNERN